MPAITAALAGLLFGASLIVAFGAQNTYVLRQGLIRAHVPMVVLLCSVSDLVLIGGGIAGAGAVVGGRPGALEVVRVVGAAFLVGFGVLAARRAWRPPIRADGGRPPSASLLSVVGACLAFTWLNPAVYLDTIVLLGSVANSHAGERWWFGAGAGLSSIGWFALLGFGARLVGPLFRRPAAWRLLDVFVAAAMAVTAVRLLLGACSWWAYART